jgi:fatty acid desaturase
MSDNQRIDQLKEQVSFLEARLTRYEEFLHGSTLKRVLFGGGRRAKLSIIEILVAAIVFLYTLLRINTGIIFAVIIGLSAVVILYSFVELNVIRKRNGTEKYQRMIDSLTAEKASMEKELARLIAAKNGLEQ